MNRHILRTQQKELAILNATINLVGTQPIEQITIDKIKSAAKVSQVTIYKLFESKDNLITTAIKELSVKAVNHVMKILTSDMEPRNRLKGYFRASFSIALLYPFQRELVEYIFSGNNQELTIYVSALYQETYPYLEKLYLDARKAKIVRDEISFQQFLKLLDMFTRIQPQFYQNEEEMALLLESLVRSFA